MFFATEISYGSVSGYATNDNAEIIEKRLTDFRLKNSIVQAVTS